MATGALMGTLLALTILVAAVLLVVLRRSHRRRREARRARETEHRNVWAEAGRRMPVPDRTELDEAGGPP